MFATWLLTVMICIVQNVNTVTSKVVCEDAKVAQNQLESYYRWWYRLYYSIFFFTRETDVCRLEDRDRQRICAEVAQTCYPGLKHVELDVIRVENEEVGVCYKQKFRVKLENGEFWKTKKRMYRCEKFTPAGIAVKRFYVSNGGRPGTVLVFNHTSSQPEEYVDVASLVSGLGLNPWADI